MPAICIGPRTAAEAGRAGFEVVAISDTADADALAATVADALGQTVRS